MSDLIEHWRLREHVVTRIVTALQVSGTLSPYTRGATIERRAHALYSRAVFVFAAAEKTSSLRDDVIARVCAELAWRMFTTNSWPADRVGRADRALAARYATPPSQSPALRTALKQLGEARVRAAIDKWRRSSEHGDERLAEVLTLACAYPRSLRARPLRWIDSALTAARYGSHGSATPEPRDWIAYADFVDEQYVNDAWQFRYAPRRWSYSSYVFAVKRGLDPARKYKALYRHMGAEWQTLTPTLNPAWSALDPEIAERLYRGVPPVEIARGVLTRHEAHDWIAAGAQRSPQRWLLERAGCPRIGDSLRTASRAVIDWVIRKHAQPAMHKERLAHGPGGESRAFRYEALLDEVTEADLKDASGRVNLERDIDAVMRSAAERRKRLLEARMGADVQFPESPFCDSAQVRVIRTSGRLFEEGRALSHCVAGYVDRCVNGTSVILALDVDGERSTAELGRSGERWRVYQHRAYSNTDPSAVSKAALAGWIQEAGLGE